jgi:hypothetical protein
MRKHPMTRLKARMRARAPPREDGRRPRDKTSLNMGEVIKLFSR